MVLCFVNWSTIFLCCCLLAALVSEQLVRARICRERDRAYPPQYGVDGSDPTWGPFRVRRVLGVRHRSDGVGREEFRGAHQAYVCVTALARLGAYAYVCNFLITPLLLSTVVFPQDLLGAGLLGNDTQMAMLGLGDIVVPGILVALMLRFDVRAGHGRAYYFWTTFWAYLAGLLTTIAVMHFFKHAQVSRFSFFPYATSLLLYSYTRATLVSISLQFDYLFTIILVHCTRVYMYSSVDNSGSYWVVLYLLDSRRSCIWCPPVCSRHSLVLSCAARSPHLLTTLTNQKRMPRRRRRHCENLRRYTNISTRMENEIKTHCWNDSNLALLQLTSIVVFIVSCILCSIKPLRVIPQTIWC